MSKKIEKFQKRAAAIIPRMNAAFQKAQELERQAEFMPMNKKREALEKRAQRWSVKDQNYMHEFERIVDNLTEEQYEEIKDVNILELPYEQAGTQRHDPIIYIMHLETGRWLSAYGYSKMQWLKSFDTTLLTGLDEEALQVPNKEEAFEIIEKLETSWVNLHTRKYTSTEFMIYIR